MKTLVSVCVNFVFAVHKCCLIAGAHEITWLPCNLYYAWKAKSWNDSESQDSSKRARWALSAKAPLRFSCTVEHGLHHLTLPATVCSQVCNKIIFLMSFVGNCGTFTRGYRAMVLDVEFLYHLLYLLICAMGLFVHEFFYSLLVSTRGSHVPRVENCVCHLLSQTPPSNGSYCSNCIWSEGLRGKMT